MASADGASSISVAVRVRPFTIREAAQLTKCDDGPLFLGDGSLASVPAPKLLQKGIRSVIKVVDDKCLVFDPPEDNPVQRFSKSVVPTGKRVKDQTFAFDRVFDENTTQVDVYEATTKNLLDSVLDGYNATVFAYGATGCGKTHTITGSVQQPGIIFLTMQELFERIADVQEDKVTEISLSYLEIYNETIRDLLVPGVSKGGLMLREDANQAVSVAGLSSHHPQNVQEVMDMIVKGNELRMMSPTEANATSSRSHAVLQINVSQKDRNAAVNEPHTMATLSIIDLAGSERASATKNRGERLMEGANINKSLLALGSCINALCDPRQRNHVPYRNSKLTRLLKFSLGGNCKTVMIVCVSPSSQHFDETQNTLRYANRAKNIQTKVTRNVYNVNRHVKDFLKKIDEQMTMINELKQQQKDYEGVAFGKFKKQVEKREAVLREGIARIRKAHEHSLAERQDRINCSKKLRQIERRIAMITAWKAAFDEVCEIREEEEPPRNLSAMRKTAQGIMVELESSRQHYHQRIAKSNWQRPIDTALQAGIKQLQELEGAAGGSELASLTRETELLKSDADREMQMSILEQDKGSDVALVQVLLHAHFETVAIINQLLMMDEQEAVQAAKNVLGKMLTSCADATSHVIRPDGSMPVIEAFPPTRSGTPKRKKCASLLGPSPLKPRLAPVLHTSQMSSSPVKASPARRRLGVARKCISFSPKKRLTSKRGVRWRDDTEDGTLAEYSKTPQRSEGETSDVSSPEPPTVTPGILPASEIYSSPIAAPPQSSSEHNLKSQRFQTGFLSRRSNGSPAPPTLTPLSSSPEASPLQDITVNRVSGRLSTDHTSNIDASKENHHADPTVHSSSESESWKTDKEDAKHIRKAVKRASLSRPSSGRESIRVHRRRSPTSGSPPGAENAALFTANHARRMGGKGERDVVWTASNILSPRGATPVQKGVGAAVRRTMGGEVQRSVSRKGSGGGSGRLSVAGGGRGSMLVGGKTVWR